MIEPHSAKVGGAYENIWYNQVYNQWCTAAAFYLIQFNTIQFNKNVTTNDMIQFNTIQFTKNVTTNDMIQFNISSFRKKFYINKNHGNRFFFFLNKRINALTKTRK